MEGHKIIEEWESFYNPKCENIRTKNGLLFLVAHWCLLNIVDMECAGNVCTSESDDETESLPQVWDHDDARLALRYKSGNQVYTLLGKVTNACYLLNFKNRQIKALSNDLILNVDGMTIVIYGKITLRKSVQEVTKLLLDELFTPVLHLSRAVSYFHTDSNGELYIPLSLENADLQYLHQHYFRHCIDSKRYLAQLKRALDGNGEMSFNPEQFEGATKTSGTLTAEIESPEDSGRGSASSFSVSSGVISPTPGGYSRMNLNPHSSSNSHYFGGIENMPRRFLTPGGYDGMLVNPTHLANSQHFGGLGIIPGSSPTPGGYNRMLVNPSHLANSQHFGGLGIIPGSSPTPGGYNRMLVNPSHLANSQHFGGLGIIPGSSPTPGGYNRMLVNPSHLANSQHFGGLGIIPGSSPTPGGYNRMLVNPSHLANSQYFGRFERIPGSWPTPGGYHGMLVNPAHLANSQYFGGLERIPGNSPTRGGYNGMSVNPTHLANSQYLGRFERIPGSSPTPTLGWGETISYRPFLTNPVGANNYRPPLERSKSAPRLMAIEEAIGEEDEEDEEEKCSSRLKENRPCCTVDPLYPAMTLGRRRCRRGHSIRRTGTRNKRPPSDVNVKNRNDTQNVTERSGITEVNEGQRLKSVSSIGSDDDLDKLLLCNNYDSESPLAGELMSYFDMKFKTKTASLADLQESQHFNLLSNSSRNTLSLDDLDTYSDGEEEEVFYNQHHILDLLVQQSSLTSCSTDNDNSLSSHNHESDHTNASGLMSMSNNLPIVLDSDEGSISSGCETASTVTTNLEETSKTSHDGEVNSLESNSAASDISVETTIARVKRNKISSSRNDKDDSDSEYSDESGYVEYQEKLGCRSKSILI
ncbi:Proteasome inhibitor PI31 subunit [Pseudolycoriella hygida]|uniref:Proteasome inhibitor PI31 subunit n=1 Tax=Pseudolycoriella hygida TaxID=35572 RepID=A0A9Q0NC10_9DIPT|nr:Proteasome inhibitor PI31 subunit [Pseudolycoriella hygida]